MIANEGIKTGEHEKRRLLSTCCAIIIGHCTAPTNLGWMYSVGRGTPVDLEKAAQYYSIAAERGDDVGQCNLGYDYLNGRGVSCNRKEAKYWLEKSAEQGNQRAKDLLRENFS